MATSSREARRRKIVDRGSDRLALITGRIQTLPSSPLPDLQPHSYPQSNLADDTADDSSHVKDEEFRSVFPKDNSHDAGPTESDFGRTNLVPSVSTFENTAEALTRPRSDGIELISSLLSSMDQSSSASTFATERHIEPQSQTQKSKLFSPKQLSSLISTTERTRLFCSTAFAILVVLSYLGFPILGTKFLKSILNFRPLFLVLLTNVTIVLAQLLAKQRSSGTADRGESRNPSMDTNDLAGQLGKALELGLLLKKVAEALFMDCAVYAVIVVCGLSFADKFL